MGNGFGIRQDGSMTMITKAYQWVLLHSNVTILLIQHLYMAEKDDRENLGDDFG